MYKNLFAVVGAVLAAVIMQTERIKAQPYRVGDIVYSAFTKQSDGILRATYSVVRSDITGYGVAFDCASLKFNTYAPDGMPGSPGVTWRWVGWENVSGTEHAEIFWKQCAKFYQ